MNNRFDSSYQFGLSIAIAVHLAFATLLLLDKSMPIQAGTNATKSVQIVEAVTIDESAVNQAVASIRHQENSHKIKQANELRRSQEQKQQELERLAQIRKQLQEAKARQTEMETANLQAANKLKDLKAQHADMAKKQLLAARRLEAVQKIKAQATKEVAKTLARRQADLTRAKQEALKLAALEQERENLELQGMQQQQEAALAGIANKYAGLIRQAIAQKWILPQEVNRQASCKVQIRLAATGHVLSVTVLRSSGDPLLDRSADAAVYKASPLPVPKDPAAFAKLRVINLTLRPEQVLSSG